MAELGRAACPAPMWSAGADQSCAVGLARPTPRSSCSNGCMPARRASPFPSAGSTPIAMPGRSGSQAARASGLLRFVEVGGKLHASSRDDRSVHARYRRVGCARRRAGSDPCHGRLRPLQLRLNAVPVRLLPLANVSVDDLLLEGEASACWRGRMARRGGPSSLPWTMPRSVSSSVRPIGKFQAIQHKLANVPDRARRRAAHARPCRAAARS